MLDKLPIHYSMQNIPTQFDEEALTSLELVGRTTKKINECVEKVNEIDETTDRRLDAQDEQLEKFESVDIPNAVEDSVTQHIKDGTFEKPIRDYCADVENRLDNLLGTVKSGSTTMDAEVIDGRVDWNGVTHGNIGTAIREGDKSLMDEIGFVNSAVSEILAGTATVVRNTNLEGTWVEGFIDMGDSMARTCHSIKQPAQAGKIRWDPGDEGAYYMNVYKTNTPEDPQTGGWNSLIRLAENSSLNLVSVPYDPANPYLVIEIWSDVYPVDNNFDLYYQTESTNLLRESYIGGEDICIDASNYKANLPDLNEIDMPSVHKLLFAKGTTEMPANMPFTSYPGGVSMLICGKPAKGYYQTQALFTVNGVYYRYSGTPGDFAPWVDLTRIGITGTPYTVCADGENLVEAVRGAYDNGFKKLVVYGVHDLIEEYKVAYGDSYFDNYTGYQGKTDKFNRGLWLENIEVVFAPGAGIVANYTGGNDTVKAYFAPISCGKNVIIDGLKLEAKNLRYGIHPDFETGTDVSTMIIRNCDLSHHKGGNCKAIGAGFGIHSDWLIENTVFRSDTSDCVFSVHNNVSGDAESRLTVRNCYIDGYGYFQFNSYGTSPHASRVMVTGCSYKTAPVTGVEASGSAANMDVIKFNNEQR